MIKLIFWNYKQSLISFPRYSINMENQDEREWVINSHRGAFKEGLLENSEESYIESWRQGANMLETDLRITKDKQIVLIHNSTIDGIVKSAKYVPPKEEFNEEPIGPVKKHTLAYLKALVFENDMHILTLEDFLEILKKYKMGSQLELKEGGYERLILEQIQKANIDYEASTGPIVCTSFFAPAILRMEKLSRKMDIPLYRYHEKKGLGFGSSGNSALFFLWQISATLVRTLAHLGFLHVLQISACKQNLLCLPASCAILSSSSR